MARQAEILTSVEALTRIEEAKREAAGGSINPELLAMAAILPQLDARSADFIRKRMAFDIVHFQEPRVRQADFPAWQSLRAEVRDYLPQVPAEIHPLPTGWRRVFSDVVRLYGDPDGEA